MAKRWKSLKKLALNNAVPIDLEKEKE